MAIWITGANRGIGLALTRQYCDQQKIVVACCRKASDELRKTKAIIVEGIDLVNDNTFSKLDIYLNEYSIDTFIHNAGILQNEDISQLNLSAKESIESQFKVNALGPLTLTGYIFDFLVEGSTLVFVTSRMGSVEDNSSGGRYGYRMSKAALNMMCKSLALDLQSKGVSICLVHPGWVQTAMTGFSGQLSKEQAASQIMDRISDTTLDNSSTFWHSNGQVLPW